MSSYLLAVGDQVWLAVIAILGQALLFWMQSRTNLRVANLGVKVEEVHIATNSMKDQLVAKTEQEALARGGVVERNRANMERMQEGEDVLSEVTTELAKLTAATDKRVEVVGEQVEAVDKKVEEVHAVVVDEPEKKS